MLTPIIVMLSGAVLAAASALWILRSVRGAGADARAGLRVLAACAGVSVLALGVYMLIGRPALAGAAYGERLDALRTRSPESFTVDEALAVLARGAREYPNDPQPHIFSGEVLLADGRAPEAARAFTAALRRDARSYAATIGLAKAMVAIDGGFTPESLALFEQASALSNDAAPWLYRAMAAMERDQQAEAQRMWGEALARMDENDPRRAMAARFAAGATP